MKAQDHISSSITKNEIFCQQQNSVHANPQLDLPTENGHSSLPRQKNPKQTNKQKQRRNTPQKSSSDIY